VVGCVKIAEKATPCSLYARSGVCIQRIDDKSDFMSEAFRLASVPTEELLEDKSPWMIWLGQHHSGMIAQEKPCVKCCISMNIFKKILKA
jgi:hypothetical protein